MKHKFVSKFSIYLLTGFIFSLNTGCKSEQKAPECPPLKPIIKRVGEKEIIKISAPKVEHKPDADNCQTCVQSKAHFISCQRVWGDNGESRDELKVKSTEKACKDAGYPNTCPKEAILSVYCKGDTLPDSAKNTGFALKKIHFTSKQRPADSDSANVK